MTLQYTTVDEKSFAYGIDARSAENQVREGFVRDLVNGDIIEGRIKKRKGHVSYAGNVPVRVLSYRQESGNKICFSLDGSIDLSRVDSTPIIVYGRTSLTGPFSSQAAKYYTGWTANLRKAMAASTTGTITAPAAEHGIVSTDIFTGLAISTGTGGDLSGEVIEPDSFSINNSTYDITADYTNGDGAKDVFLYYLGRGPITGETYSNTYVRGDATPITISAATHQLATYNIVPQVYIDESGVWKKILPDSFTINTSTGEVNCTVPVTTSTTIKVILSAVSSAQTKDVQLNAGIGQTLTLPDIGSPFIFGALYTKNGTTNSLVLPDSTTYSDTTKNLTLTYTNGSSAVTGVYYYNYGTIRANELCVTDSVSTYNTDSSPQLTIYGLSHGTVRNPTNPEEIISASIYGEDKQNNRRGWVTHIDSYRSPSTTHLVSGLGGNLFAALTASEVPAEYADTMPTYYARLQSRLSSPTNIGPAFYDTGAVPARTRGTISFDNGGTSWAIVTGVSYQSLTGWTRYILSTPNRAITGGAITDVISITPNLEDYLTVKNMSHSRHSGDFVIKGRGIVDSNTIYIDVENTSIDNDDYDDAGCQGLAGIFTDQLPFTSPDEFLSNDQLLSSSWGEDVQLVVKNTSGNTTVITNVYDYRELATGLLVSGQRTGATLSFRDAANIAKIDYLVAGDVLTCPAFDYPLVILSVDTTNKTVTLDRKITWYDDTTNVITFSVSRRWVPREMPTKDSGDTLINDKITRYFANNNYDNQPFLRSAMVQNNLYLTNGDDEVYKYDGANLYRAGIIPWQPGLFATTQSGVANGIKLSGIAVSVSVSGSAVILSKADAVQFPVGTVIKYTDSTNTAGLILTVATNVEKSASDHTLTFKETFAIAASGTSNQIALVYQARYAFRLNIKDRNGVTVASAVTGAEDFVVQIAPAATTQYTVNLKLVGLPSWDHYDYSNKNIELKIYRTLWVTSGFGEVPVFYEVATKQIPYVGVDGYLVFNDKLSNDTLVDVDPVVSVLSPEVVPAGWDEPVRAKYLTSAGNRLVLANVTDWPTLAITYLTSGSTSYTDFSGQKLLFRRDSASTATGTDMLNTVTYELRGSGGVVTGGWTTTSGTSFTFAASPGLIRGTPVVGDWVYLYYGTSTIGALDYSGWWQISNVLSPASTTTAGAQTTVTTLNVASTTGFLSSGSFVYNTVTYNYTGITPTSFTGVSPSITVLSGQTITGTANRFVVDTPLAASSPTPVPYAMFSTSAYDVPVNIDGDYNMGMANGDTVSFLAPANRILRRVGMAINATMRMVNKSVHSQADFIPWLVARSESDTQGQLLIKQPRADATTPSAVITNTTSVPIYVNGSKTIDGSAVTALTTRYPSRLLVSYNNYPEIFDNPFTVNDDLSASAIDINSSDGQEITGVIPFFGESAFGAALQSGVIVVFKQNSIYLVDLAEKRAGRNPVQRIETQGLGCTAPYSIAPTKDGIAFANDSGIYVLRRNQRIEYLGRYMERNWQNRVDRSALDIMQGHHYNVGRQYKLSIPLLENSTNGYVENSEVYVYNHTNEGAEEPGGWGRYTNHPATGWANLFQDAFYASANGVVMRLRNEGIAEDYRDGADAITVEITGRATDFGQAGIRKVVSHVIVNYRTGGISESTSLLASPDLLQQYDDTTPFAVVSVPLDNGFSTTATQDVVTIRHSLVRRRCIYMTVKISNNGLDEALEIAGMSYVVAGLNSKGITQAANTKK